MNLNFVDALAGPDVEDYNLPSPFASEYETTVRREHVRVAGRLRPPLLPGPQIHERHRVLLGLPHCVDAIRTERHIARIVVLAALIYLDDGTRCHVPHDNLRNVGIPESFLRQQ